VTENYKIGSFSSCDHVVSSKGDMQIIYKVVVSKHKTVQQLVENSLEESFELNCCRKQVLPRISVMLKLPEYAN
jgi:hypothetical protein